MTETRRDRPMPSARPRCHPLSRMMPVLAIPAVLLAAPAGNAAPAGSVNLDGFLSTFRQCAYAPNESPFGRYTTSLVEKYGNDFSEKPGPAQARAGVRLTLPPAEAAAFGEPSTVNHGDHTALTVPVTGTFGGLPVTRIEFSFGNENGINAATLVFDVPRTAVAKAFGASVAKGNRKGRQEEASGAGAGYSAEIPKADPGRISCDWST